MSFDDIVGTTVKLALNDAFYTELPTGNFIPNQDLTAVYMTTVQIKELKSAGFFVSKEKSTMNLLYRDRL